MNGVRRLLGATTVSSPPPQPESPSASQPIPIAFAPKTAPTWPPSSSPGRSQQTYAGVPESPKTTAGLFLKKDRPKVPPLPSQPATTQDAPMAYASRQSTGSSMLKASRQYANYPSPSPTRSQTMPNSHASGSSSPHAPLPVRKSGRDDPSWKQLSGNLNTRDELLISLMASEAVIDSRDFDILSAEEVDELKKEHQVLTSRLGAMTKKLGLETKIRDAALSLSKVNASHKKVSKQTGDQLDAANQRVESAQKEVWKLSDRVNEVHRRLMEHRAGVLSFSIRNMERKASDDSGYDSSNRSTLLTSPAMSNAGFPSPSTRFDGAHLFAGHADTIVPKRKLTSEAATAEITALEEKLQTAKNALGAASKKQADMARELSLMRLEKQEVETMMGMDLQAAEETIAALEREIPRLEQLEEEVKDLRGERDTWEMEVQQSRREKDDAELELRELRQEKESWETERGVKSDGAEQMLQQLRASSARELAEKDAEIAALRAQMADAQDAWAQERQVIEDDKMEDLARLQEEMDDERSRDDAAMRQTQEELAAGLGALQGLIKTHGVVLFARDTSLQGLLNAVGMHLETVHVKLEGHAKSEAEWEAARRRLEEDVRGGMDKREALARELEDARRERDAFRQEKEDIRRERDDAKRDTLTMEGRVKSLTPAHRRTPSMPITNMPYTAEESGEPTDAGRIIAALQPLWAILPSPEARAAKFGSSNRPFRTGSPTPGSSNGSSVITSLSDLDVRSLKSLYHSGTSSAGNTPASPKPGVSSFSIEAFTARVQALIQDDKALIERLVRFAQAHDLLKKNAERAQKLAQDGNHALETYQKQVRMLEERNMSMTARQTAMQDELNLLHETIERITSEKHELEALAAEQAQTCEQLTEANNTLSARALALAEDAAQASDMVRKQYEAQLQDVKKALDLAQEEVDAMRTSEQTQRIALLDELNSMQTENSNLRAQLRAAKK